MNWIIEKRKQGNGIYVTNRKTHDLFIGDCSSTEKCERSMELAKSIAGALNIYKKVTDNEDRKCK